MIIAGRCHNKDRFATVTRVGYVPCAPLDDLKPVGPLLLAAVGSGGPSLDHP